jgi:CheY-like chemotaxis protein
MLSEFAAARVLVIDDEPGNLTLLQRLLVRRGLQHVVTEADPRRAVATLDETDPDIVLLDLHMPGMTGHDVLVEIRRWAAGAYLPVIVLTADTTAHALEASLSRGATDFLTKPFNATEIVLRIRNLLHTRELYRTLHQHVLDADSRLDLALGRQAADRLGAADARRQVQAVLAAGGPRTVFQPVVDVTDGATVGYEALSRFEPGTGGPASWFDGAADAGLGPELELAAASGALAAASGLPRPGFVAVNLSPATVVSGRLDDLDPGEVPLVVELTERVPVEDYEAVNAALAPLRAGGTGSPWTTPAPATRGCGTCCT